MDDISVEQAILTSGLNVTRPQIVNLLFEERLNQRRPVQVPNPIVEEAQEVVPGLSKSRVKALKSFILET